MWKNLVKSGITFALINTLFLLILRGGYSFLTLACYGLLAILCACATFAYGTIAYQHYVLGKPGTNPLEGKRLAVPRESFAELGGMVGDLINAILLVAADVFFVKDFIATGEFALGLLFAAWLGKKARLTTLAYLATLVLFIWPRLYKEQHEIIDQYAGIAYRYVIGNIQQGIAIVKDQLPAKVGPFKIKNA